MNSETDLPSGWQRVSLEQISDVIPGNSPPSSTYNEEGEGLPFYQGKTEFRDMYPEPEKWCTEPKKVAEKDDVLVSVRAPVGPTNLCPDRSCIGRGLAAVRPKPGIQSRYILWAIRAFENELALKGTGTTFDSISSGDLREFEIPLPPSKERESIVAKIEELFSNLDAGRSDLATAEHQLERYRLSVLQAAVEGRLTADWRRTHDPEPADELLERAEEKETVNKYKNRGKLTEPDADLMYEIPETWEWVQVGDLASAIRYGTSDKAKKENKGIPMLRMGDIEDGVLHYDDLKYLPEDWEDKEKFLLRD